MQQISIIGHIGKDAVVRSTNGKEIITFNVGVNADYTNGSGETVQRTNWYSCIFKRTGVAQYLKKGDKVWIQGELNPKIYVNDRKEASLDLTVNVGRIEFLSNKKEDAAG